LENHGAPASNVNTTPTGTRVKFTPVGLYRNVAYEPITNTNIYGASGTWASSNPLVMYVNPQGLAYALSGGTANITYTSPTGVIAGGPCTSPHQLVLIRDSAAAKMFHPGGAL